MIGRPSRSSRRSIGTRPACRALGASPATIYRRRRPPAPRPPRPRPAPARALSEAERERCWPSCTRERFVDSSPAQVWATLLDEGRYLASERTMYRLLAAEHGGVRERRDQLTHPAYAGPSCSPSARTSSGAGTSPSCSGPAKWTYFYLYVILDVFSRYVVGWTVQHRESAPVAKALIAQAVEQQQIAPGPAHRARRSRQLDDLQAGRVPARRPRRHQDPQPALHLDRQPLLRGAVQDAQVPARVPAALRLDRARPRVLPRLLRLLQPRAPPLRDRPDDPGDRPPRPRRAAARRARPRPRRRLRAHARTVRPPRADAAAGPDRRLDQQAQHRGGRSRQRRRDSPVMGRAHPQTASLGSGDRRRRNIRLATPGDQTEPSPSPVGPGAGHPHARSRYRGRASSTAPRRSPRRS